MKSIRPRFGSGLRAGAMALPAVLAFSVVAAGDPQDPPVAAKALADAGAPASTPLTILAVDPAGSIRVRLGPGASGGGYLNFTLLRLRPGTGAESEAALLAGTEMVKVRGEPADVEVFRGDAAGADAVGPCRLEVHQIRQGVPEESALASAGLWRGGVEDWLRALEAERQAVLELFAGWKGGGDPDDYALLARIQEFHFFTTPVALMEVYRQQQDEAATRSETAVARPRESPSPDAVSGTPSYGLLNLGGTGGETSSSSGPAPPPSPGAAPPGAAAGKTGDKAGTGAEEAVAKPEGPSIVKIRRQVSREALAHLLLAAEHLAIRAALPDQDNGGFAGDWRSLAEGCGRLVAEDPGLREADKNIRDAGLWSAVPPDASPEKVRALDLKELAKRARDLRGRVAG